MKYTGSLIKGVRPSDLKHIKFQFHVKVTLVWRGSACFGC